MTAQKEHESVKKAAAGDRANQRRLADGACHYKFLRGSGLLRVHPIATGIRLAVDSCSI